MRRLTEAEVINRVKILERLTMSELSELIEDGYDERYGHCDAFAQGWYEARWEYDGYGGENNRP